MAFDRKAWVIWMSQQDRQAEGGKAVFWRPDPIWNRLLRQDSWGEFLKALGREQRISVDCEYSAIIHGYRCELTRWTEERVQRFHRSFLAEGYGGHPLSAILAAVQKVEEPISLSVRLRLLRAFVDYLEEEIWVWADGA